jgi:adenosylcobinamide-GDP ribazoletransferase
MVESPVDVAVYPPAERHAIPPRACAMSQSDRPAPRRAGPLGQFGAAWTLLTRLPWPFAVPADMAAIGRGAWAFPLVGAILGALVGGAYWLASRLGVPPLAAAGLAIGLSALLTGALHEDGLADTADGFGGGGTPARKLEIMRDSRIGSYGVVALAIVLLIRAAALGALTGAHGFAAAMAAAALGRGFAALPMTLLPPARTDGLGRGAGRPPAAAAALALALAVAAATGAAAAFGLPWPALGCAIALAFLAVAAVAGVALRQIGGTTGDVLGAAILSADAAALVAFAGA